MKKKKTNKMVELLLSGATMLSNSCPVCASPLFKVHGDIYCPTCDKKVLIVKEGEESSSVVSSVLLPRMDEIVSSKLQDLNKRMEEEKDPEKLRSIAKLLNELLDILEKIRRIQKS
ncbi:MAG: Sjogren's syndrome/scleroderma autoantigen 1 family protein [Promethearchaeota archaeon]